MARSRGKWFAFSCIMSILAVLGSGCTVFDTVLRGVADSCARPEFVVTRTDDPRGGVCGPTDCSLRQAVTLSNACPGAQTIRIPAGDYTLALPGRSEDANLTGDLDILQSVSLIGDGRPGISANNIDRVLEIHAGATVALQNLGIAYGSADGAPGDGLANYGSLSGSDLLFYGNSGSRDVGGGGGLWNAGTASISHSAFIQNYGQLDAAGVNNEGMLTLDNVTFTNNRGYAIENRSGGHVQIAFSTIANNAYGGAEAAYEIWNAGAADSFVIGNSIVAGHVTEGNCLGSLQSNGFNLDSSSAGGACGLNQPSDLNGLDPMFEAFSFTVHPVLPLGDGSPALDSADPARCGGTDQRGVARPQGPACDRGAYERETIVPPLPAPDPFPTITPFPGLIPTPQVGPTLAQGVTPQAGTPGVSIESLSSDIVYVGKSSCGSTDVTITARAVAPNPIDVVVLFYDFGSGSFQDVAMTPVGGDLFRYTLNPTALLGANAPFEESTLVYQVVVQQKGGDVSVRTPVLADIALLPCGVIAPADCASYDAKKACESHGCSWAPSQGNGPYVCQNP